jgi:hypothetical protein
LVLRLAPDRVLLDLPRGATVGAVASVWVDEDAGEWRRAAWPRASVGLPIAPLDLWVGHVVEFGSGGAAACPTYACVLGVSPTAIVIGVQRTAFDAVAAGRLAHEAWLAQRMFDAAAALRSRDGLWHE